METRKTINTFLELCLHVLLTYLVGFFVVVILFCLLDFFFSLK